MSIHKKKQPDPQQMAKQQELVEQFCRIALEKQSELPLPQISLALLQAASRINAFTVAAGCQSGDQLNGESSNAQLFFEETYRKMLTAQLKDFAENFDRYRGK